MKIFKTVWSKKTKLLSYSATSFSFTDIYCMVLGRFLRHFLVSSVKKHAPVNFQDQRFFETDVIKEKVVFKLSAEAHQVVIFKKYHQSQNAWSWRLIFLGLSCLYHTYHWWKMQKRPWDKDDMIQKFLMIWQIINPLKHASYRYKLPLKKLSWLDIWYLLRQKIRASKMNILRNRDQKFKKHNNFTFHD